MGEPYGMHGHFTARPGKAQGLEAILLEAADLLRADPECLLYVVARVPARPDDLCVTEAWTGLAAHDAALADPRVRELIERARPLLAGAPDAIVLRPVGGKGLSEGPLPSG